ncbi:unnamed protein product [Lepeophtheirus salmonis]|uniref:(salmon louse) hypothetical protein n=1 Tax=Lepeophtheirus salmonis TaxID=72036 RepID=A0A7R8H8P1_LEPSM|nr:unnamed protein product [Lepeophtheirus salmonis]CAF2943140.1 unnamed protein product [Lepeophtheirus salmonis]
MACVTLPERAFGKESQEAGSASPRIYSVIFHFLRIVVLFVWTLCEEALIHYFASKSPSVTTPLTKLNDTVLHFASQLGYVRFLISLPKSTPWNIQNSEGKTPLHDASQFCQAEVVSFFIKECKLDPDPIKRADWTPVMLACTKINNLKVIPILVEDGNADLSRINKDGWTPFHLIIREGDFDAMKYIISQKSDAGKLVVTTDGHLYILLHCMGISGLLKDWCIVMNSKKRIVLEVLLLWKPFAVATWIGFCGELEILKYFALLIDPTSEFSKKSSKGGMTVLHWAANGGQSLTLEYLVGVVKSEVIQTKDDNGRTPLDHAIVSGSLESVKVIINALLPEALDIQDLMNRLGNVMKPKIKEFLQLLDCKGTN